MESQVRIRQGKGPYPFEMDEKKEKAIPRQYNILDMCDEELGDFLNEEVRKALKVARQQRKVTAGRDLCKEMCEAKERESETLKQRNNVLEAWARQQEEKVKEQEVKQRKLEKDIQKMASLISQLMGK